MIHLTPFSTFGACFIPIFAAYFRKHALSFGKVSAVDKLRCRIVETYPKVEPTFREYSAKQAVKPLSKPQVGGKRI